MKGIILAGGTGTRLYPITKGISKQLMPIYDKPMIYYPLTTLIQAGIQEILIITTSVEQVQFKRLLGNGDQFGIHLEYGIQLVPRGIAEAFIIAEKFIGNESVCLILGDNIFYGAGLNEILDNSTNPDGGIILGYHVSDPQRYGVVEFNKNMKAISIEEKPSNPRSKFAIPGIYFYDNEVVRIAKNLKPSARLEYEITDISMEYLKKNKLKVKILGNGFAWLDTGTFDSMVQATEFIKVIEDRQSIKVGSPEEAAYNHGFIDAEKLEKLAKYQLNSGYGDYLLKLLQYENDVSKFNLDREKRNISTKKENIINLKKLNKKVV